MARGYGELHETIESDGNHIWNSSGTIENLAGRLESQIDDWQIALIHNNWGLGMIGLPWDLDKRLTNDYQIHRYKLGDRQPSF